MDPSEVEFLAEKEMVKIIPNFSLDKVYLIGVSNVKSVVLVTTLFSTVKMVKFDHVLITRITLATLAR